ncbi:DUF4190 domain-containing protein [Streptomyces bacillaris]|uniref:DUF4190 domain-containing protein n=1 Tax=Streptomyces cavourensis TaxID=67258 RepID=A0AAD0Q8E7_9ACTN|nr:MULTISPECIES: DUF4190 domain-containing protein [Streptomyces]NUW21422.1 DUF4190 domain-containing protein [Streptomyces roseoviolaceus]AXI74326.1 DUF4190 domain-containing protein [Streptomyces cavourensis]NUV43296.1 DUF4190 domain-containing protein [Streptomyces sp. CAI-24]NUV86991.1 DUF4190 domain-containing protein [Streptomyces sp. KAI-26]UTR78651.1 DUF4190 domain-containing protein [Streptomyces cavourensis]
MSDNTEQPGGGAAPRDPWAPPDSGVELGKKDAATPPPPAVHDQQTVTSMPSAGPAPDGTGPIPTGGGFGPPPSAVPPPPIGPGGPGQAPPPPTAGHYGYPAPPAQPYGGYPGYDAYGGHQPWGPQPSNGLGTAALVLGIISVVGFCMYGVNIVLGILALIFGIIGLGRAKRGEATNRGMAIAGIITGSVGIVLGSVLLGFIIWAVANGEDFEDGYEDDPFATSLVIEGRG